MNGDVIALAVDLIQALAVLDGSGQVPCRINRKIWVIAIYFHAKTACCVCHHGSNGSKTDDTKLFAADLASCELFFLLLGKLADVLFIFLLCNPLDTSYDISGCKEHTCKYQLFYAVCVSSRRVEYNNTLLCILLNRNIIDACTCTCNCANALRQLHVVHFCTSYKDCITLVSGLCFFIIIAKKFQTFFSDRIQAMILEHYAFSSSNFFMNATSASTPAFGMAL